MLRSRNTLRNDSRAEVGIGTMIVFIATILVAAIAAGVLISTSQKLQAKSTQTGNEATQNVVGSLTVLSVQGVRETTAAGPPATYGLIDEVDVVVQLAAGADPVDLSALVIQYSDGTNQLSLNTCATVTDATTNFDAVVQRGTTADCGVMVSGDLVKISLGKDAATPVYVDNDDGINQNERVTLNVIPNHGSATLYSFTVPNLGTGKIVNL